MVSREYKTHYRACAVLFFYLLYTITDLCFSVHNLETFPSNTTKVHFEALVHLLGYIRDNKNLGLKYYAKIEDAPLSDLFIQVRIKTENQLMMFSDSIWQDWPDNDISIGAYILFYQGGLIAHFTHVTVTADQYSTDSEYDA